MQLQGKSGESGLQSIPLGPGTHGPHPARGHTASGAFTTATLTQGAPHSTSTSLRTVAETDTQSDRPPIITVRQTDTRFYISNNTQDAFRTP